MKNQKKFRQLSALFWLMGFLIALGSCSTDSDSLDDEMGENVNGTGSLGDNAAIFLFIDEDSIDNGNEPNNFSETDVNDNLATVGQRRQLRFFEQNVGQTIDLFTGQVGDEGWHAPKTIPNTWINTGPTNNGLLNYLVPGPGLGGGEDDKEALLDDIRNVIPLRATALTMLTGETVYAVVYDSDISTNYSPIQANLQGANLGIVAFKVVSVSRRNNGSDSDLPRVTITILDAQSIDQEALYLFQNAPEPRSSSEPEDTNPPANVPQIQLTKAN
ncbi:hypothetical protein U1E44_10530 [Arenibacter sp. GZD96]|uniref:hypothetical protein n=1 Tax=Aurantibrevibacter litoralis TaxID=3106030 RepID=UPI002AFE8C2B|nr:hypothetical protein [Arenibacter sp. GZD-96]MEA1786527.1 hypothetical protein [Arenibacter sp. GZD-96]